MNTLKRFNRTISIYSKSGGLHAAAIAGAIASGRPDYDDETKWSKPEKTRPKNPNKLTILQHVYPTKSIARLINEDGKVEVLDLLRGRSRRAKPSDPIFCARRAWDQRAESGYMREIEEQFQEIAERTIANQCGITEATDKRSVERFFALWYMRSRYNQLKDQEFQLNGVAGDQLTLEQEENLERDHYLFIRSGGRIPARQLNGIWLQQSIDQYAKELEAVKRWGLIRPLSGEIIIPDLPRQLAIPLQPDLFLFGDAPDGLILRENLAEINRFAAAGSRYYYLARRLDQCPLDT
ncbi:hypothetical protein [Martelella sp. HB161492]|uniref:hypothetical protein n=1 Tax=Martelella sp. HB161492 TaxID=2720726 RepID=UPI00158FEB0A|nr:hypothetical protein [Martelella sp. HB161492]